MTESHKSVTVVRDGAVLTAWDAAPIAGDLVIEDGTVVAIEPNYRGQSDLHVDAGGCLVLPGFTNAHVHPGGSPLLRGIVEDLDLPEDGALYHHTIDLRNVSWEILSDEEILTLVEWEAGAMLLGGATNIISEQVGEIDQWLDVATRLGFRTDVGRIYPYPPAVIDGVEVSGLSREGIDEGLVLAVKHFHEYNGSADGRISIHLSPHGTNTVPDEVFRQTREFANELGMTIHLHISQHPSENASMQRRAGMSPVAYMEKIGLLGPDVLATHLTYTDASDWDILARTGTSVVHCPYRKGKEGITGPYAELLGRGVNVCLATETYCHDLLGDLRIGAMLGKVRSGTPATPTAPDLVKAVTASPNQLTRRPDLGNLNVGSKGDVTIVSLRTPYAYPIFDALRSLVYYTRGSDMKHSLVDGKLIVENGKVVNSDMDALAPKVNEICNKVWSTASERNPEFAGPTFSLF